MVVGGVLCIAVVAYIFLFSLQLKANNLYSVENL